MLSFREAFERALQAQTHDSSVEQGQFQCLEAKNIVLRNLFSFSHNFFFLTELFLQCDLVPAWVTKGWLRVLSKEYPSLAFHASINKSFGKVALVMIGLDAAW